jgi:hypothetical protein
MDGYERSFLMLALASAVVFGLLLGLSFDAGL